MARKTQAPTKYQDEPSLTPEHAVRLLRVQRDKGKQLLDNRPITSAAEMTWKTVTRDVLSRAFGASSPNVASVMRVGTYAFALGGGNEQEWERQRAEDMTTRLEIIDGLIELLESNSTLEKSSSLSAISDTDEFKPSSNHVFLVHGHDEAAIHETARFLESLEQQVTILREQPNSGRTIIEKFVDFSDVAFAIVLLTGDDRGGKFDDGYDNQKPRARQNVILELGFFLGKLGRKRVCALYQEGVDIPSDYSGVLFVPLDINGAWRLNLARELKAVGLHIDMNKAV
jgi:predicted nucleotide-binding protein